MFGNKQAKWKLGGEIAQQYIKRQAKTLPRYARERIEDFDPEDILHAIGLMPYRPGRIIAGSISTFLLGVLAGSVFAMLLTPKSGEQLRSDMRDRAKGYLGKQPTTATTPGATASA